MRRKSFFARVGVAPRGPARDRGYRPAAEALEGRALLALTYTNAAALVGARVLGATSAGVVAGDMPFGGTVDFDPGPGTTNLSGSGFVARYTTANQLLWARTFAGRAEDVAAGPGGNLYVVGDFSGTIDLDPGAGTVDATSAGQRDLFLVKLDPNGNFLWGRAAGGTGDETASAVAVDSSGTAYATGRFFGTADLDPGAGVANVTSVANSYDAFLWGVNTNGTLVTATSIGGSGEDVGLDIAVKPGTTRVVVTGYYSGTADLAPGAGVSNFTSAGQADIFVVDTFAGQSLAWARSLGGTGYDQGQGVVADASGNVYTTGWYYGTGDFDPGPGVLTFSSLGNSLDVFLSKLDANGNQVWARSFGGNSTDRGYEVALDGSNNPVVVGSFSDTADFDPNPVTTANLTSASDLEDAFVAKYSAAGSYLSAVRGGGFGQDWAYAVATSGTQVLAGGEFGARNGIATATFGPYTLSGSVFVPNGFFAWLSESGSSPSSLSRTATAPGNGAVIPALPSEDVSITPDTAAVAWEAFWASPLLRRRPGGGSPSR